MIYTKNKLPRGKKIIFDGYFIEDKENESIYLKYQIYYESGIRIASQARRVNAVMAALTTDGLDENGLNLVQISEDKGYAVSSPDSGFRVDDPKIREAFVKSLYDVAINMDYYAFIKIGDEYLGMNDISLDEDIEKRKATKCEEIDSFIQSKLFGNKEIESEEIGASRKR